MRGRFFDSVVLNHFLRLLGSKVFEEEKATLSKEPKKERISRANFISAKSNHFTTRTLPRTSFPFIIHLSDDFFFFAHLGRPILFRAPAACWGRIMKPRITIARIRPVISIFQFLMFIGLL